MSILSFFNQVQLSLQYVEEGDNTCLVLVLEKVYVCCGSASSTYQKNGARELAKIMLRRRGIDEEGIIGHQSM